MARSLAALILSCLALTTAAGPAQASPPSKTSFKRAKVTLTKTNLGRVITDAAGYAQYYFSADKPSRQRSSRCYGRCAEAWPPLVTKRRPLALGGAKQGKLGVTKRRNGDKQVTYAGRPIYYYEHEPAPEIVTCHDVFLNGGYWYAFRASGKRLR